MEASVEDETNFDVMSQHDIRRALVIRPFILLCEQESVCLSFIHFVREGN